MDKKDILAMIFVFTFLLSGCETAQGVKKDVDSVPQIVANTWHQGDKITAQAWDQGDKITAQAWQQAQKMDEWIQKNLW